MVPVCPDVAWKYLAVFLLMIGLYPHFKDLFINYNSYYYGYIYIYKPGISLFSELEKREKNSYDN